MSTAFQNAARDQLVWIVQAAVARRPHKVLRVWEDNNAASNKATLKTITDMGVVESARIFADSDRIPPPLDLEVSAGRRRGLVLGCDNALTSAAEFHQPGKLFSRVCRWSTMNGAPLRDVMQLYKDISPCAAGEDRRSRLDIHAVRLGDAMMAMATGALHLAAKRQPADEREEWANSWLINPLTELHRPRS